MSRNIDKIAIGANMTLCQICKSAGIVYLQVSHDETFAKTFKGGLK